MCVRLTLAIASSTLQATYTQKREAENKKKKNQITQKTHGKSVGFVWFGYSSVYQPCVHYNWGLYPYIRIRRKNIWLASVLQHTTLDSFSWMFGHAHTHTGVAAHSVAVTAYRLHDRTTTTPCGPEEIIHLRTDGTNRSNDNQTQHTNSVYAERAATISSISLVAALWPYFNKI